MTDAEGDSAATQRSRRGLTRFRSPPVVEVKKANLLTCCRNERSESTSWAEAARTRKSPHTRVCGRSTGGLHRPGHFNRPYDRKPRHRNCCRPRLKSLREEIAGTPVQQTPLRELFRNQFPSKRILPHRSSRGKGTVEPGKVVPLNDFQHL